MPNSTDSEYRLYRQANNLLSILGQRRCLIEDLLLGDGNSILIPLDLALLREDRAFISDRVDLGSVADFLGRDAGRVARNPEKKGFSADSRMEVCVMFDLGLSARCISKWSTENIYHDILTE